MLIILNKSKAGYNFKKNYKEISNICCKIKKEVIDN